MPQMAPLNWLSLYFFFFLMFILSIILNYYMFLYTPKKPTNKIKKISMNWKW
uniref:ATP synthase complex subunit 8 n=1 Tax=Pimelocerus perforatus TaxID=1585529 RepID=A0A7S6TD04_9CUCU|nr:ATP synthase F0 subunit 8 [Pimelocerus perforatus]QOU11165.1 ATP synthase F0 subunit 8 [Pimelocerus perforatus]